LRQGVEREKLRGFGSTMTRFPQGTGRNMVGSTMESGVRSNPLFPFPLVPYCFTATMFGERCSASCCSPTTAPPC
jgi:hypothetical protein